MYFHSNIGKQIIEIFKNAKIPKYKPKFNDSELVDINDGDIFKKLLNSEDGDSFKSNEAIRFLLNTESVF